MTQTTGTVERLKAFDHLLNEVVETQVRQVGETYEVTWVSGDEEVLVATCVDRETSQALAAVPGMIRVMRQVMEEHEFMGTVPRDIVDECANVMDHVFREASDELP